MRSALLLCFFHFAFFSFAQPGDMDTDFYLGLYDPTGKAIDPAGKRYLVSFSDSLSNSALNARHENNKFFVGFVYNKSLRISLSDLRSGQTMVVYTRGSMDSLNFQPGTFSFNMYEAFLYNVQPVNATIIGKITGNFKAGAARKFPRFYYDHVTESEAHDQSPHCYQMAEKMENQHGGKNWIRNACNDQYEDFIPSTDEVIIERIKTQDTFDINGLRTHYYPYKKNMYLRHQFDTDYPYRHTFSLSTDGCKSWKTLMRISGDWYVHLLYFPGSDRIGIEIANSGVVLLTDDLSLWKFYLVDLSEEPPVPDKEVLVLKNANWYDDIFGKFYFSE